MNGRSERSGTSAYEVPQMAPFRATIDRVGSRIEPEELMRAAVEVFQEASDTPEEVIRGRFRDTRAFHDLESLLGQAKIQNDARIVALGGGSGFGARSSGFVQEVALGFFLQLGVRVDRLDISPELLPHWESVAARLPEYDLAVSHSFLHYIYNLRPLCDLISALVRPGGAYVMGNEPNRRFWLNPDCLSARQAADRAEQRERALRCYISPRAYAGRVARLLGVRKDENLTARANRILRRRFGWRDGLTTEELVGLCDPHRPTSGGFKIGLDGLDHTEMEESFLNGFHAESVRTSGYVRKDNPYELRRPWRDVEERLAAQYPLDGAALSVLWRKRQGHNY